jgi:DNA polymerase III delta prime subunit
MRGVMEAYADNCRFMLTCNYPNKIIPALHSRCQGFHVDKIDATEFTARCATILVEEGVEFDLDTLDSYVIAAYPDLRKCINNMQMASVDGKLMAPREASGTTADYKIKMVDLFKHGKIKEARTVACNNVRPDEMEDMFRWMYDNLSLWSKTPEGQDRAIVIIRNGLVNHSLVADPEINLSATLVELTTID